MSSVGRASYHVSVVARAMQLQPVRGLVEELSFSKQVKLKLTIHKHKAFQTQLPLSIHI